MERALLGPAKDLVEVVRETARRHLLFRSGETVVVGFSGGADSLALLHLLRRPEWGIEVHAAHLNHLLRGTEADEDAEFVQRTCADWGVPLTVECADVARLAKERGLAVEEAARQVRYAFLGRAAEEVGAGAVAVAHHADDQVETVVMHFLRGSGLAGLRGMLPSVALAGLRVTGERPVSPEIRLIRPLLHAPRSLIEQYCAEHGLEPRFDRSNLDTTYFRNRLRLELIPYLETFNPNVRQVIRRTAEVLAADHDYLRQMRDRAWAELVREWTCDRVVFDLEGFRRQHLSLRRALLREAIARLRPPMRNIDWVHVEQAVQAVQEARGAGVRADLPQGLMLTVGYGLFALADESVAAPLREDLPQLPPAVEAVVVPVPGEVRLGEGWRVRTEVVSSEHLPPEALDGEHPWTAYLDCRAGEGELVLRRRREGERMQPLGMEGRSKKLSELMINLKIGAPYRERYPILARGDTVLWLPGHHVDHRARITEETESVLVVRMERA
ncbi:MAG: tRNA lysidine(34) synthetase TilS [Anaerolineae bacterium]|nr:tRNA lysidine(34) synthetase TilS [Anaerolineae bacterium]